METETLKKLTLRILKSTSPIPSSDFIQAYNLIYSHCTSDIDAYEIKGNVIYNTLTEALIIHFKSFKPISSLDSFYSIYKNLNLNIIEKVYSYLSRFYIKINLDKNNNVSTIKYLFYTLIYKYGIYNSLKSIEENLIFEINCFRETYDMIDEENLEYDSKRIDMGNDERKVVNYYNEKKDMPYNIDAANIIKTCIKFLRDLYLFNDNECDYEKFINSYILDFNESLRTSRDSLNLIKEINLINKEIEIVELIFEHKKKEIFFKITKNLTKNYQKLLEFCFTKDQNYNDFFNNYDKISKIIIYMSEPYINDFFIKIDEYLSKIIYNINQKDDIINFYIKMRKIISHDKMRLLQNKIENEIISKLEKFDDLSDIICLKIDFYRANNSTENKLIIQKDTSNGLYGNTTNSAIKTTCNIYYLTDNFENSNILNNVVNNKLSLYKSSNITNKSNSFNDLKILIELINLLPSKNKILNEIGKNVIKQIINEPELITNEIEFIKLFERECGSGSVSWIKLILEKYNDPISYYIDHKFNGDDVNSNKSEKLSNNEKLTNEQKSIEKPIEEKFKGINILINNYKNAIKDNFDNNKNKINMINIKNNPNNYQNKFYFDNFSIDVRMLTKIFCNLKTTNLKLWNPLENIVSKILKEIKNKNPKSGFIICHEASFVIFEFNEIEIKMGLDKFSLFVNILENGCEDIYEEKFNTNFYNFNTDINNEKNLVNPNTDINLRDEKFNEYTKLKNKNYYKDLDNFSENIEFLINNNLVIKINDDYKINYLYTNEKQKVNLFNYKINEISNDNFKHNKDDFSEQTIESLIMKELKQRKEMLIEYIHELMQKQVECDKKRFKIILEKLKEKGFVEMNDGFVKYLP